MATGEMGYVAFVLRLIVFSITFYWLIDEVHKSSCIPSYIGISGIVIVTCLVLAIVLSLTRDGCLPVSK